MFVLELLADVGRIFKTGEEEEKSFLSFVMKTQFIFSQAGKKKKFLKRLAAPGCVLPVSAQGGLFTPAVTLRFDGLGALFFFLFSLLCVCSASGLYILSLLLRLSLVLSIHPGSINNRPFFFLLKDTVYQQVVAVPKYLFDCCCPLRKETPKQTDGQELLVGSILCVIDLGYLFS